MTKIEKQEIQNMINEAIKPFQEMMTAYFNLFERTKGFFEVNIPNETTLKAMQDADTGNNLHTANSIGEMLKELKS